MPFYSRRIGLYEREEVPILWGGKVNGKVKNTHFGSLITQTGAVDSVVSGSKMGVVRVKQNILKESSFGIITTVGDPGARNQAWTAGVDFTYQTSSFGSNKNFLVGAWGMVNSREGLEGDKSAVGIKIDYPNDLWDWFMQYRHIGDAFDPSMGFVSRRAINSYSGKADFMPRPENRLIRQHKFQFSPSLIRVWTISGRATGCSLPLSIQVLKVETILNLISCPRGNSSEYPFEISEGVTIEPGGYHWMRYRLEASTASKRAINGMATYWFGGFYGGRLDQIDLKIELEGYVFPGT